MDIFAQTGYTRPQCCLIGAGLSIASIPQGQVEFWVRRLFGPLPYMYTSSDATVRAKRATVALLIVESRAGITADHGASINKTSTCT